MKCNLLIDSSFILFKNAYTLVGNKTLYGDLERSLEVTYENYMQKYPFENIYLIADSRNYWRKKIYPEYKGKRKEAREKQDIDWDFVFNTHNQFKEKIKNNPRVKVIEIDSAEADDIIAYIIRESNKKGISNLYVSSDGDLNQLLDYKTNPNYINIQWRDTFKNGKLFFPYGYKYFMNELNSKERDIFNMDDNFEFLGMIEQMMERMEVAEIDIEKLLFVKFVHGDVGDNIKSVFSTPMKSNPLKMRGIGQKGAEKIYDNYKANNPETISFLEDEWFDKTAMYIAENKKVSLSENEKEIIKGLKLNRSIIHLDTSFFPEQVLTDMKKIII